MKNKTIKSISDDVFIKFLIALCYVFMVIGMIASITIRVTAQEFTSSSASIIIIEMLIFLIFYSRYVCI